MKQKIVVAGPNHTLVEKLVDRGPAKALSTWSGPGLKAHGKFGGRVPRRQAQYNSTGSEGR